MLVPKHSSAPFPGQAEVKDTIRALQARAVSGHRRYVPGELAKLVHHAQEIARYQWLGTVLFKGSPAVQQLREEVASAWRADNSAINLSDGREAPYVPRGNDQFGWQTIRARGEARQQANTVANTYDEWLRQTAAAQQAHRVLGIVLEAGATAVSAGQDPFVAGLEMYDRLPPNLSDYRAA